MKKVLEYLSKNRSRFIEELCDYVRFPSVSAQRQHRKDMRRCADWLAQHCQRLGLEAQVCPTPGHPVVLARTPRSRAAHHSRPHFVVYGHYDVQPAEPFDLWRTPPFQPLVAGASLYGRGASDNKGQHFAHLKAIEAYLQTGTPLPCDITFLIEGEEEVGSENLPGFLKRHHRRLQAKAFVVSDTGMPDKRHPALTCGLRGIAAVEVKITGPSRDLHSGIYGGSVLNPATALCQILAQLHDGRGRVAIPGFYDEVRPLTPAERKQMARVPFNREQYRKFLGVPELFGEKGYTPNEQRGARPTLEINGLTSGYQGEGSKTIVPASASAKITLRLVPHQDPDRILRLLVRYLRKLCPPAVRMEITTGHSGKPYLFPPDHPLAQAALRALQGAFGRKPVLLREGGSIPIVNEFKSILGADTLLLGLALPDDNPHAPNEKFDLECFTKGMVMSALLWPELAAVSSV
ncbi:dipeptidase [Fontisphaera persica]|uniref:dipeptidase n=1 Tax=Fontisphaera persica TaxID=2974023 RepID=UPI0024BFC680|nr:dipeptidase [Fontisphaera persica]WCJ60052.1 dipeptidase [Fontisphaera persica]